MTEEGRKKSLRCRLGAHVWYSDSAMFASADRCDRCGVYSDPLAAEMLAAERKAWSEVDSSQPWHTQMGRVVAAVLSARLPHA